MNISNINGEVFAFAEYNLNYFRDCDCDICGHYLFWWHKPTGRYVFCKFGDFHNLVSIRPVKEDPRFPTDQEKAVLDAMIKADLRHAYFWVYEAPNGYGPYLLDDLEAKCEKRDGHGTEWFPTEAGERYGHVFKTNGVHDAEYPGPDYQIDKAEWEETKRLDELATVMLGSKFEMQLQPESSWINEKIKVKKVNENQ